MSLFFLSRERESAGGKIISVARRRLRIAPGGAAPEAGNALTGKAFRVTSPNPK
jgi:hypothetical protein